MSSKRSQRSNTSIVISPKRTKNHDFNNYFHKTLIESGLTLKHPPEKCVTTKETIHIVRNIKKNLENHFEYPRNVSEFYSNFETECRDIDVFKHYLFPNIVRSVESGDNEYLKSDTVIKILLSVPILQNKLMDYIFEKAIDFAAQSACGPWIQMILRCFSSLDSIVDSEKLSTNLINLLDIASEKMVRLEIITAIPDIIGDQEYNNVSIEISRLLTEDHELIPAVLDCLTYLCLTDDQYEVLQKKTLTILMSLTKCLYFPNFIKFLLLPNRMPDTAYLEAVQGLRNALCWPTSIAKPQDIASSQVLTAAAIRSTMVSSKVISNAWFKAISNCKIHTDYKPIDFIILIIMYSTSEERQKQVESLIRKHIKLDILQEETLNTAFEKFKPILKENLKILIELANSLLKNKNDPAVESFGSHMYTLLLSELDDCSQTVVAELLQLGLDSVQCVNNILVIFNNIAEKNMSLLKPQSVQMLTLLDRMDDMPLDEVRGVMNILCGLAYKIENSVIRDDMHMIIRKELSSSDIKIKVQGILAGIHAVKYLIATEDSDDHREMPDDISYSSTAHLSEGNLREAGQIIELISRSTRQCPDLIAFYYDELSNVVESASFVNNNFLSWLTVAVTNDLQQNFIVDSLEYDHIGNLKLHMRYCLNSDSEMDEVIAMNIAGLALQPNEICIDILSPLFQLVQTLHCKKNSNDLSSIDALLGCAVIMPQFDVDLIEDMDTKSITSILDCLVHCGNWFRELLNAFAIQKDVDLKCKILQRVAHVEEIEKNITEIIVRTNVAYKPPICAFNINKYTGENVDKKINKPQTSKKQSKRNVSDETVLPETARSQATQNNLRSKIESSYNIQFRKLNKNLINLIKINLSETEKENELTVNTLNFILKCVNNYIENILISKIKRKTFLSKQESVVYDSKKAEECAKSISEVLPRLMDHLDTVTCHLEGTNLSNTQNETSFLFTAEKMDYITCLESIYSLLTTFFKWIGFKNHHNALLKSSLRSVANPDTSIISLKELLVAVAKKFEKHEKYCLLFSTAISLIELMKAIQSFSDNRSILSILKVMAQNFMSRPWKSIEGAPEKGLRFNQGVDSLASIYFINNEILALKNLTLQLTNDIRILKGRNDTLSSLRCINKSNFPILYRHLGTALYEATKTTLAKGMTNSEHLDLWKDVATVLKCMSDIAKTLDNRNNLSAFFKKSIPILKLFLSQGMPIIEIQLKSDTQEIVEILKILQQSTRFLQSLCCHSRLKKDSVLMSKVPFMRQLLETLIYKVKAALAANKCSAAFWMGNLKNKNIHGEVIATQQSIESEESNEDCDDQLPEDDEYESDDDNLLNPDSRSVSDIV